MEKTTRSNLLGTRTAVYSTPEKTYRYKLTIDLGSGKGTMLFIGLNPSTATELENDPTIARVERRARDLGYGTLVVCNIFAFRATDPKDMFKAKEPIGGSATWATILESAKKATLILCGWGTHGVHLEQGRRIEKQLRERGFTLHSLGINKDQSPKHPLYLRYGLIPEVWESTSDLITD